MVEVEYAIGRPFCFLDRHSLHIAWAKYEAERFGVRMDPNHKLRGCLAFR